MAPGTATAFIKLEFRRWGMLSSIGLWGSEEELRTQSASMSSNRAAPTALWRNDLLLPIREVVQTDGEGAESLWRPSQRYHDPLSRGTLRRKERQCVQGAVRLTATRRRQQAGCNRSGSQQHQPSCHTQPSGLCCPQGL